METIQASIQGSNIATLSASMNNLRGVLSTLQEKLDAVEGRNLSAADAIHSIILDINHQLSGGGALDASTGMGALKESIDNLAQVMSNLQWKV
jgi:hypothetical protein